MNLTCYRCNCWPCECADGCCIVHGDCREVLPELGRFDAVVSDPPYGINYNPTRSQSSAASGNRKQMSKVRGDADAFDPSHLLSMSECLVLWGANHYANCLPNRGGWLVWDKRDGGSVFRGFQMSDCELAWCTEGNMVRMFSHRWCGHLRDSERDQFWHPTQKPVSLMRWCIEQLSESVESIIDPYMGSGTTLRAAKDLGRKAIGIEIEERYCEIAARRLEQGVLQFA